MNCVTQSCPHANVGPVCGLAIVEQMSGHRTEVEDPFLEMALVQQPAEDLKARYARQFHFTSTPN